MSDAVIGNAALHAQKIGERFALVAFVIGAAARDLMFEYVYDARFQRATEDLDFGVAVATWADYDNLKTSGFFRNECTPAGGFVFGTGL